jgi:hypothetical protein
MRFTVVCSVRNEGPFLVEWVSWYRRLGFGEIVIVSNACTDHSPALLDALHLAGWITHLRHEVPDGQQICAQKLAAAKALPQVAQADWVLVCDVDEFLTIHSGAGRIGDLIPDDADFLGMAVNWRVFGTSGQTHWQEGLTHRLFTQAAETSDPTSRWVKTLHAHPDWFRKLGEHGPKRLLPRHAARWGQPGMRWVNVEGATVPSWHPEGEYLRRLDPSEVSHSRAQMNHYMIRSQESFWLKKGQLSSVAGRDRYTDAFYERYNRNDITDTSALRHGAGFDAVYAKAMTLPQVARLHHLCCADYLARIAAKAGRAPQDDPRYGEQMAKAAAS